jgi:hypothetical protein
MCKSCVLQDDMVKKQAKLLERAAIAHAVVVLDKELAKLAMVGTWEALRAEARKVVEG